MGVYYEFIRIMVSQETTAKILDGTSLADMLGREEREKHLAEGVLYYAI